MEGYALRLISHLQASEENYPEALRILQDHFYDKDQVIAHLFTKLDTLKPGQQSNFLGAKLYLTDIRCILSDLDGNDIDLLSHSPTAQFIANKIVRNLPPLLVKEICTMANSNYPTYSQIFKHFEAAIVQLNRVNQFSGGSGSVGLADNTKGKHDQGNKGSFKGQGNKAGNKEKFVQGGQFNATKKGEKGTDSKQARDDGRRRGEVARACVFDGQESHSSTNCPNYVGVKTRKERARALKRCAICLSAAHLEGVCKYTKETFPFECKKCNVNSHISPFCTRQ